MSIDCLNPVLGPVPCPQQPSQHGQPPALALVLSRIFCLRPHLSCGEVADPLKAVLDLGLVPSPTPLLEVASAPVCRNPRRLVWRILPTPSTPSPPRRPRDDAGGGALWWPCCTPGLSTVHRIFKRTSNHTAFHVYSICFIFILINILQWTELV